jgi:hypothetical protein
LACPSLVQAPGPSLLHSAVTALVQAATLPLHPGTCLRAVLLPSTPTLRCEPIDRGPPTMHLADKLTHYLTQQNSPTSHYQPTTGTSDRATHRVRRQLRAPSGCIWYGAGGLPPQALLLLLGKDVGVVVADVAAEAHRGGSGSGGMAGAPLPSCREQGPAGGGAHSGCCLRG